MLKEENQKQIQAFMENIIYLRRRYGLSKKEMSRILGIGIGIGTLNKIEQGVIPKRLSVEVVFRIQYYFGIPAKNQFEPTTARRAFIPRR